MSNSGVRSDGLSLMPASILSPDFKNLVAKNHPLKRKNLKKNGTDAVNVRAMVDDVCVALTAQATCMGSVPCNGARAVSSKLVSSASILVKLRRRSTGSISSETRVSSRQTFAIPQSSTSTSPNAPIKTFSRA